MDYQEYERECTRIRAENARLLSGFEAWLAGQNLSPKTINKHVSNADFYINEFLLYEDAVEARNGAGKIDMFLGNWFIRKAAWASKSSIRGNATSLKKFYSFMVEQGLISRETVSHLTATIKASMPDWLATVDQYYDPDIDDLAEVWGFLR